MTMLTSEKTRPSDGSDEEKKEEEIAEAEKQKRIAEEDTLAKFVAEAEADHDRIEQHKKDELEKLKKEREKNHEDQSADGEKKKEEKLIYGQKVKAAKEYTLKKGFGIFNSKGRREDFGSSFANKKIERTLKVGAHGIPLKKQREFIQLLGKYHGLKGKNSATFDKDEVMKFEAGLRRGSSDARFKKLSSGLKQAGVIKNSADVRKFFSKLEVKRMSNALLGRKDENTYKRLDKSDLTDRRSGSADPKSMRRF